MEKLETAGIISPSVSPCSSPIVIVPEKAQSGEQPQKCLCVDYHASISLLPPVVETHL